MQDYLLNALVILESVLLLVISIMLFTKTQNLTKLKKYEEAFIENQAKKQAAQEEFLPMLVHELRAPISVVRGAVDLLMKSTDSLDSKQIHTLLNQIKVSSTNLLKMVGDILDVSKMEKNSFQINKTYSSLEDILKEQCGYFQSLAKVKNISLNCASSKNIMNFSFDSDRIKQVIENLLSNAVKYSHEGGEISVKAINSEGFARIEISDNGIGIPDQDKPLLFHKFFQASNQGAVSEKGSGLGLVIAKGIVEAHGGRIWAEDNKPRGSKFIFTLPLL